MSQKERMLKEKMCHKQINHDKDKNIMTSLNYFKDLQGDLR
jgi:hypothetical protein